MTSEASWYFCFMIFWRQEAPANICSFQWSNPVYPSQAWIGRAGHDLWTPCIRRMDNVSRRAYPSAEPNIALHRKHITIDYPWNSFVWDCFCVNKQWFLLWKIKITLIVNVQHNGWAMNLPASRAQRAFAPAFHNEFTATLSLNAIADSIVTSDPR
jgi:hypothetical protein